MDRLQRPPDRLDVVGVERPVGVVEVDPEADPLGQPVPLLDVAEHLLAAAGVELGDPVALDVVLRGHPELGLDRQLDRQAVAVPAALALDVVAGHRPVAGEDVLEHAAQDVVRAGVAVGGRRALVEAPLRRARAPADRLGEHLALAPALEHLLARARGTRRAGLPGDAVRSHGRGILGTHARARACARPVTARAAVTAGRLRLAARAGCSLASSASRAATGCSPEPADGARAGVGDGAAVVEHRRPRGRPSGPRRRAGRSSPATPGGRSARRPWGRAPQRAAEPRRARPPGSAKACAARRAAARPRAPGRAARRGRTGPRRRRSSRPRAGWPAGQGAAGPTASRWRGASRTRTRRSWHRPSRCAATASSSTSSIVRSTERRPRLSSSSRLAVSSSKDAEGAGQARRGRRPLAALAGQRDRRGDVVGLGQRQPQRLDLGRASTGGGRPRSGAAWGSRSGVPSCAACWG